MKVTFSLFLISMILSLIIGISMVYPLLIGFFLFSWLAMKRGFSTADIIDMIRRSLHDSFIVIGILLLIGCLTGLWRASGTIAYFVSLGVSLIPPSVFILAAFLLTTIMSFALGTSFGVTATAGVILMSIARAGNVNTILTAGAIFSGVYVGDRGSPAASSGNLVAVLTHTDMRDNVRIMFKSSVIPLLLCMVLYTILSFVSPMQQADTAVLKRLSDTFHLTWQCLIPAVIMIILPFAKVSIRTSMIISIIVSLFVTVTTQNLPLAECLRIMCMGYTPADPSLASMLAGGGIASMAEVCVILFISGTYGEIFKATKLLDGLMDQFRKISGKIGRFPFVFMLSVVICGMFCNQTIGIIMQNQLTSGLYTDDEKSLRMLEIEDSVVLTAGLVPWCIACSVPLAMLGEGFAALPFAFYLYLVPLCHFLKGLRKKNV